MLLGSVRGQEGTWLWRSAVRLLDYSDPKAGEKIRDELDAICSELTIQYHGIMLPNHRMPPNHRSTLVVPTPDIGQRGPPSRDNSGWMPAD